MNKAMRFEDTLEEIINALREKIPGFKGIYYYGSRVKGEFTPLSDYDITVVLDRKVDPEIKRQVINILYDFELKYDLNLDIRIYRHSDILNPVTPFRQNVLTEGIFYAA